MATYVTSESGNSRHAHIGHPVTLCGLVLTGRLRVSDDMPYDREACPRCVAAGVAYGVIAGDEAEGLRAHQPVPRVAAIFTLLCEGCVDETIARRLGISARTVTRHVGKLMEAVNARSRWQAGYLYGLLGTEGA